MAALTPFLLFLLGLVSTVSGYLDIYPPVDESDTRTPLHFALLQSFGSEFNGSGAVAGLQVALDRINSDPTLLPGYSLHYTLTDSQVRYAQFLSEKMHPVLIQLTSMHSHFHQISKILNAYRTVTLQVDM